MKLISPFSPYMMKTKATPRFMQLVNETGDRVLADPEETKKFDLSPKLVGKVKKEIMIPIENEPDRKYVTDELRNNGFAFLEAMMKKGIAHKWTDEFDGVVPAPRNLGVLSAWIVSSYAGDYNPWHWHGGDIGGLIYLKIPKGMAGVVKRDKEHYPSNGLTEFAYGDKQDMRQGTLIIKPRVGDFYVFPSWLRHFVYPFDCEGERRTMSFNLVFRK